MLAGCAVSGGVSDEDADAAALLWRWDADAAATIVAGSIRPQLAIATPSTPITYTLLRTDRSAGRDPATALIH